MKTRRIDQVLSTLDKGVRWTGLPARVAEEMAGTRVARPVRALRWFPLLPIALATALVIASFVWPSVLEVSFGVIAIGLVPIIQKMGPLGTASTEDDEREAALRGSAWFFCLAALACLNCLGQPLLAAWGVLRHWSAEHTLIVAGTIFMLNACLFGCLPTLYASWSSRQPENE
jgi:hypothetical protein